MKRDLFLLLLFNTAQLITIGRSLVLAPIFVVFKPIMTPVIIPLELSLTNRLVGSLSSITRVPLPENPPCLLWYIAVQFEAII